MEDNKVKFFDMLSSITEVAKVQSDRITADEVVSLFGDLELSKEQYDHVYAYLIASGITVDGASEETNAHVKSYQPVYEDVLEQEIEQETEEEQKIEDEEEIDEEEIDEQEIDEEEEIDEEQEIDQELEEDAESVMDIEYSELHAMEGDIYKDSKKISSPSSIQEEKDSMYLTMYLEDLCAVYPFSELEEEKLLIDVKKNDSAAVSRLIEGNLLHVVEIAKQYTYSGELIEDLIGEGNMGLMAGVGNLSDVNTVKELREHIELSIRNSIFASLDEVVGLTDLERRLIERANYLNSASNELAEDMGRSPSLEELSEYTKISVEDINDILHISANNIKVNVEHTHGSNEVK